MSVAHTDGGRFRRPLEADAGGSDGDDPSAPGWRSFDLLGPHRVAHFPDGRGNDAPRKRWKTKPGFRVRRFSHFHRRELPTSQSASREPAPLAQSAVVAAAAIPITHARNLHQPADAALARTPNHRLQHILVEA